MTDARRVSIRELGTENAQYYPLARVLEDMSKASSGESVLPVSDPNNMRLIADELSRKIVFDNQGNPIGVRQQVLSSGFTALDEDFGLLYPGLVIFESPYRVDVSSLATQLSWQIMENNNIPVVYFTYTDPWLDVVLRFMGKSAGISRAGYIRGQFNPSDFILAAEDFKNRIGDKLYVIQGTQNTSAETLKDAVLKVIATHYKGLNNVPRESSCVVVLEGMESLPVRDSEATIPSERLMTVGDHLKDIVKQYNIPVLTFFSSGTHKDKKTIARDDGFQVTVEKINSLQGFADVFISLRPGKSSKNTKEIIMNIIRNRNGYEGKEKLLYNDSLNIWTMISTPVESEV